MGTTFIIFRDGMHQVQLKRGPIADCFTWFKRGLYFPWGLKDTYCFAVICHRASSSAMRWDMRETVGDWAGFFAANVSFRPFQNKIYCFSKKNIAYRLSTFLFFFATIYIHIKKLSFACSELMHELVSWLVASVLVLVGDSDSSCWWYFRIVINFEVKSTVGCLYWPSLLLAVSLPACCQSRTMSPCLLFLFKKKKRKKTNFGLRWFELIVIRQVEHSIIQRVTVDVVRLPIN
jgi:hypothetical protein